MPTAPGEQGDRAGAARLAAHALVVLLTCAGVYWPGIGAGGLTMTEGHRVIPAWEMLESGDWLLPRMFGQVYLRKPPGMAWAVAASSSVLGPTEFAARAVSAAAMTATAFLAFVFAARWFGGRWALAGGLAMALTPLFWAPGRGAEIEALHNLGAFASVALIIDVLTPGRASARPILAALPLAASVLVAVLTKGPAALPCLAAAVGAACLVQRSIRPCRSPVVWSAVVAATAVTGVVAWRTASALAAGGERAILQSPGEFLWTPSKLTLAGVGAVLAMPLAAWASALPSSLALLFPWGSDARAEAAGDPVPRPWLLTRTVAWTILLSLGLAAALGVDNPRYAMPGLPLAPMLVPYVLRGLAGAYASRRRVIARVVGLGHPAAWVVALAAGAAFHVLWFEPRLRRTSGREAGIALAASFPDGAEVWANDLIEARPEVLLYAARHAAAEGRRVRVRWVPSLAAESPLPPRGGFVVLRTDAGSGERTAYAVAGRLAGLEPVAFGRVHKYAFTLYRANDRGQ
jgi:4-amino-4-deoxy-L-arabinose transferase-like glycosyltransferase